MRSPDRRLPTTICAYPWDLVDDPSAAARIAALGVDGVQLAANYHSVRAATPLHPRHRVVDAQTAALYVDVRATTWRGRPIVPASAHPWAGPDSFQKARDQLAAAGLPVEAWVVLTHSTHAGRQRPRSCVVNAFGDRYPYALCPSDSVVVDYAVTIVTEVVTLGGVDALVLEAIGPLGVEHLGHHEKTAGADWSATDRDLLSICFCAACRERIEDEVGGGAEVDAIRDRVRAAIGSGAAAAAPTSAGPISVGTPSVSPPSVGTILGDAAAPLLAVRRWSVARIQDAVLSTARRLGVRTVRAHAHPDPWATGPASAVLPDSPDDAPATASGPTPGTGHDIDSYVVAESVLTGRPDLVPRIHERGGTVGAYVSALPPRDPDLLAGRWAALADAGVDELHVYHAGLLSPSRLDAVASALDAVRSRPLRRA